MRLLHGPVFVCLAGRSQNGFDFISQGILGKATNPGVIGILSFFADASSMNSYMPARRLEDRIRELCARALYEKGPQWVATVHELQSAIQEHTLRLTNLTTAATVGSRPDLIVERRHGGG